MTVQIEHNESQKEDKILYYSALVDQAHHLWFIFWNHAVNVKCADLPCSNFYKPQLWFMEIRAWLHVINQLGA